MKGSIIIVSFFVVGVLLGRFVDIPNLLTAEEPTLYALYALMFLVGISIGSDKKALEALKHQNFKIILVPLATIIGTLAGSALISLVISGKSLTDCLAVGSGFGYYSLSTIFITQYKGAELGTIALVSNILRELIALLAAPPISTLFRETSTHFSGRCYYRRHNSPYYHEILRKRVCNYIYRPRNTNRFKCTIFSNIFLYCINFLKYIPHHKPSTLIIFIIKYPIS